MAKWTDPSEDYPGVLVSQWRCQRGRAGEEQVEAVAELLVCASWAIWDSLLWSGFDPVDLFTGLAAPTTCKSSTCSYYL